MDAKKTRQGRNSDGTPHLNAKATRQERNSDETPYAGVIRESDPHPAAFLEKGKTHVKAHWSHGNTHAGHYVQKAGAPLRASVSTHHQRRFFHAGPQEVSVVVVLHVVFQSPHRLVVVLRVVVDS